MNSKCLRLVRICLALFVEKSRVISYKRGLLFCYRCVGFFPTYLKRDNRQ